MVIGVVAQIKMRTDTTPQKVTLKTVPYFIPKEQTVPMDTTQEELTGKTTRERTKTREYQTWKMKRTFREFDSFMKEQMKYSICCQNNNKTYAFISTL